MDEQLPPGVTAIDEELPPGVTPIETESAITDTQGSVARLLTGAAQPGTNESFRQEFSRRQQEEIAAGTQEPLLFPQNGQRSTAQQIFERNPLDTAGRVMAGLNLPFAQAGITPLINTLSSRILGQPTQQTAEYLGASHPIAQMLGQTAELGGSMMAPWAAEQTLGKGISNVANYAGSAGRLVAEQTGKTLQGISNRIESFTSYAPRVEQSLEKVRSALRTFPSKLSPEVLTGQQVGEQFAGNSLQPQPRLAELGLYGEKVQEIRTSFDQAYGALREATTKIPTRTTLTPTMAFVNDVTGAAARTPREAGDTLTAWARRIPTTGLEGLGDSTNIETLKRIASEQLNPSISVAKTIENIQTLRDKARSTSSILGTHKIEGLAQGLTDSVAESLQGTPYYNQWLETNANYRAAQPLINPASIPGQIAQKPSDAILGAMFPKGAGNVDNPRAIKALVGQDKFNAYARTFDETMLSANEPKASLETWNKMSQAQKDTIYGPVLAREKGQLLQNLDTLGSRQGKIDEVVNQLNEARKPLLKSLHDGGYHVDPESPLGTVLRDPTKYSKIAHGGFVGATIVMQLAYAIPELARGAIGGGSRMTTVAGFYHLARIGFIGAAIYAPKFLPSISSTVAGARILNEFLAAGKTVDISRQILAANALRNVAAANGFNLDQNAEQLGLRKDTNIVLKQQAAQQQQANARQHMMLQQAAMQAQQMQQPQAGQQ